MQIAVRSHIYGVVIWTWRRAALLATAAVCLGACSGEIGTAGSPDRTPNGSGGNSDRAGGVPGSPGALGEDPDLFCDDSVNPGPAPVRRLTRFEYNNTVRDLLGDTSNPANGFPPEEVGNGFGNDALAQGISALLADQYFVAAKGVAGRWRADPARFSKTLGCVAGSGATAEDRCAQEFLDRFGLRAFRRPLEAEERSALMKEFSTTRAETDFATGIETIVTALLQMPQFLYRLEWDQGGAVSGLPDGIVATTGFERATRLSYLLWASMPDDALFAAARDHRLETPAGVGAEARRMLDEPAGREKARAVVRHFHGALFGLAGLDRLQKNRESFPNVFPELGSLFRQEVDTFLDHIVWSGDGALSTLLAAPYTFANARLAAFYGVAGPKDVAFERVAMDPKRKAGLLTSGGVMAATTPGSSTNPVVRGAFVRTKLFCDPPPDPPIGLMVAEPEADPTLTSRQRFLSHQTEPACVGCHLYLDPIGHGFENYDGIGQWRETDNNQPIDATGHIEGTDVEGDYSGPVELAQRLAGSAQVAGCYADNLTSFAMGRGFSDDDACTRQELKILFRGAGGNIPELLVALTQTDAFLYRPALLP